jgi:hypothetical protein
MDKRFSRLISTFQPFMAMLNDDLVMEIVHDMSTTSRKRVNDTSAKYGIFTEKTPDKCFKEFNELLDTIYLVLNNTKIERSQRIEQAKYLYSETLPLITKDGTVCKRDPLELKRFCKDW